VGARVLVVEDDPDVRGVLRRYLERAGYHVLATGSGGRALRWLEADAADLALVDLGLPDLRGEDLVAAAAAAGTAVIVLTARDGEQDRIRGLELGADDYVTKPFSPRELVLRVRAVLHRRSDAAEAGPESYGGGTLVLDDERHEARIRGRVVALTPSEWGVLVALAARPGRVLTRAELVNVLHDVDFSGYERSIDSHVKNLRRKLLEHGATDPLVDTVTGTGYRLAVTRDG
jgi:DNA-binding response OmpR family regulator